MKRVVSITVLAVVAAAPAALGAPRSIACTASTTRWVDNKRTSEAEKIWIVAPDHFRFEQTVGDKTRVSILNGADFWVISPQQKQGLHLKLSPGEVSKQAKSIRAGVDMVSEVKRMGGKRRGQSKIGASMYDVYKVTSADGLTTTLYVAPGQQQIVRRREQNGILRGAASMGEPMQTHEVKSVTDYANWQVDTHLQESLFRPPAGVTIREGRAAPPPTFIPPPTAPRGK